MTEARKKSWIFLKCCLKSLDDFWYTLFFILVNMGCFYKSFLHLNKFNEESWQKTFSQKSFTELYVYIGFLILNVFIFPIYVWTSLFKIGSYASDGLKYGHDLFSLDKKNLKQTSKSLFRDEKLNLSLKTQLKSTKCFSKLNKNSSSALNASSATSPSNSSSSPSSPKKKSAFKIFIREFLNLKNYFSLKKFLRYLPISNVLHIILAFNFIFPSIFLTAKEIEYDLRPSSLMHHSKLDFIFTDIFNRFSDSQILHIDPVTLFTNKTHLLNHERKLHFKHLTPGITLEMFNYSMSLLLLMFRYSSTFWYLNKVYSLAFSVHLFLFSCVSILNLSMFDVLCKYESVYAKSVQSSTNNVSNLLRMPIATNLISLTVAYVASTFLLFISCLPIYAFGIKEYKQSFRRLQIHFNSYIQNKNMCKIMINQAYMKINNHLTSSDKNDEEIYSEYVNPEMMMFNTAIQNSNYQQESNSSSYSNYYCSDFNANNTNAPPTLTRIPSHNHHLNLNAKESVSIYSNNSNRVQVLTYSKKNQIDLFEKLVAVIKSYKYNFQALIILTSLFVSFSYLFLDSLFLYQLTRDKLALTTCVLQSSFFLWYFIVWLYLSVRNRLNFKFNHAFKLNYWYFLNKVLSVNHLQHHKMESAPSSNSSSIASKQMLLCPTSLQQHSSSATCHQQQHASTMEDDFMMPPVVNSTPDLNNNKNIDNIVIVSNIIDEINELKNDSSQTDSFSRNKSIYENFNLDLKKTMIPNNIKKFQKKKNSASLNSIIEDETNSHHKHQHYQPLNTPRSMILQNKATFQKETRSLKESDKARATEKVELTKNQGGVEEEDDENSTVYMSNFKAKMMHSKQNFNQYQNQNQFERLKYLKKASPSPPLPSTNTQPSLGNNLNEANRKLLNKILIKHKELIDQEKFKKETLNMIKRPKTYKYFGSNSISNMTNLNGHDTDSGRHSLTESPSTNNLPNNNNTNQQNEFLFTNNSTKKTIIPTSQTTTGSFTSKCIFTSGNEIVFTTTQPKQHQYQLNNRSNIIFDTKTSSLLKRVEKEGSKLVHSENDDDYAAKHSQRKSINLSEL